MPNPFLSATQLNRTKRNMTDRPTPETPRPESYVGENNPYRGTNDHGVESASHPEFFTGYEEMHSGEYRDEPHHVEAIPVIIVHSGARELRQFRVGIEFVDSTNGLVARLIAGRNDARTELRITNNGAGLVYYGETESVTPYTGYPVPAGKEVIFRGEVAVWFVAAAGTSAPLAIHEEYTVVER